MGDSFFFRGLWNPPCYLFSITRHGGGGREIGLFFRGTRPGSNVLPFLLFYSPEKIRNASAF